MTNDNNQAKGSSEKGLNRRKFVVDTGVLLGTVAVGEFAIGEAQAADAEQGSDGKKLAPNQIGIKPATNRGPWDPA